MLISLIQNIALLAMLAFGLQTLEWRVKRRPLLLHILEGLLFGLICIVGMMAPVHFAQGIIYDGRSIILILAGLSGGPIPAIVAALIGGFYWVQFGGVGVGAGAWVGTVVIAEAAALGIGLFYLRKRNARWERALPLLLLGFLVHGILMVFQLLLPGEDGWAVWEQVGLFVLLGYVSAFWLAAQIFLQMEHQRKVMCTLMESEEQYRSLFENNQSVMMILDPETGSLVDANPAAGTFYGWSRERLKFMNISEINTLPVEEVRAKMRAARQGSCEQFYMTHRLANGTLRDVEVNSGPIVIRGQRLLFSVIYDITEIKKAEDALRRSEAFKSALISCAPFALYSLDMEGTVQSWNESAERTFGWTSDEVIGKLLPIIPEDQMEAFVGSWLEVQKGFTILGREVPCVRKDGSTFTGRLSFAGIRDVAGSIAGAVCAMEDVTNSKDLEEQLRQAQKMESIGRLAGGVAHDFNNMLGVILGHTELALQDLPGDSALHTSLEEIQKAAQRSSNLTRQLLAFARRQTIAPKILDLNETVEPMLKMLRRLIGESIDLVWEPAKMPVPILIDPAQIDQILANLVVNARDAIGSAPGRITIKIGLEVFSEEDCASRPGFVPGRYVMLAVSDDGCGMDERIKSQVFEPFFTTKPVGEGTGLGLATIYGIVRQNNGFIDLQSEQWRGTEFRIYLPAQLSVVKASEPPKVESVTQTKQGKTILVVEDEAILLTLIAKMLERLGYSVLTASTPGEAIRLARQHKEKMHLLITDVVMPEMTGRELAEILMSAYPSLKCLYMSGYAANAMAPNDALNEEMLFIQKPFSMQDFGDKILNVLHP